MPKRIAGFLAWLGPQSLVEALFEHFASAARDYAAASGAITVLVSHRFSTVRMADQILVVAGGRVVESGNPAEVVRENGLYAELYGLQARAYR